MKKFIMALACLILGSCTGTPDGVTPVQGFDAQKYLGTWYEIARLDHRFERGLDNVTAQYAMNDDGSINVINKGFSKDDNEWNTAEGRAKFVSGQDTGHLKVSFFGPFYGSYVIFDLDQENYQYSFVSGPNKSYLWLLSRTPQISPDLKERFIEKSRALGFSTDDLIWVNQDKNLNP